MNSSSELVEDLKKHVVNEIGIIAKPEKIIISDSLPKTRSGKIMRRILRSLASGEKISGDISTLEDSSKGVMLKGTHTIIASAGLRENFLGDWADDEFKRNTIKKISNLIDESD